MNKNQDKREWLKTSPRWNRKQRCQLSLWHMSLPAGAPRGQGEGSWSTATSRPGRANNSPALPTTGVPFQQLNLCVKAKPQRAFVCFHFI